MALLCKKSQLVSFKGQGNLSGHKMAVAVAFMFLKTIFFVNLLVASHFKHIV